MAKICLITPGQPSTNPRLVKEADALVDAGHEVEVICAHWANWADETDKEMMRSRGFKYTYVGGHPTRELVRYNWTRLRHKAGRILISRLPGKMTANWSLCRVTPDLIRAAKTRKSDLYIAHNLGALPAAVLAAQADSAKVGFDAEDLHSGTQYASAENILIEHIERKYLPDCDYVTASAPLIAKAYKSKYGIAEPATILNVFPLSQRPPAFREAQGKESLKLYWFSQTIGEGRGLEDMVRAIGQLNDCAIELHLQGTWQSGFREKLFQMAGSSLLNESTIRYHPPSLPDEMVQLSSQYDVGLALEPGRDENNNIAVSNKIFTYLLAGNAVIATKTRGQQLLVNQVESAVRFYEPGDVEKLVTILKNWMRDRSSLDSARRIAWELGSNTYNWDVEKSKFLKIVSGVLASRFKMA